VDAVHLVGVVREERMPDAVRDRRAGLAEDGYEERGHRKREGHAISHLTPASGPDDARVSPVRGTELLPALGAKL